MNQAKGSGVISNGDDSGFLTRANKSSNLALGYYMSPDVTSADTNGKLADDLNPIVTNTLNGQGVGSSLNNALDRANNVGASISLGLDTADYLAGGSKFYVGMNTNVGSEYAQYLVNANGDMTNLVPRSFGISLETGGAANLASTTSDGFGFLTDVRPVAKSLGAIGLGIEAYQIHQNSTFANVGHFTFSAAMLGAADILAPEFALPVQGVDMLMQNYSYQSYTGWTASMHSSVDAQHEIYVANPGAWNLIHSQPKL